MINLLKKLWAVTDNRKTYILCALWILAWYCEQYGYVTKDLYQSIFAQTGPIFPTVIAALRSAIGENK